MTGRWKHAAVAGEIEGGPPGGSGAILSDLLRRGGCPSGGSVLVILLAWSRFSANSPEDEAAGIL